MSNYLQQLEEEARRRGLGTDGGGATDRLFGGQEEWSTAGADVSFWDRAKTSFGGNQDYKNEILQQYLKPGETIEKGRDGAIGVRGLDGVTRPLDPEGLDLPGDLADLAGDLPEMLGGALGATAGAAAGNLPGAMIGGASGAGLGEIARQQASGMLGSSEREDVGKVGQSAIFGALGEAPGAILAKFLKGPFRGSTQQVDVQRAMDDAADFDVHYGTDIAGTAPASARSGSDALANIEQRTREHPFAGQRIREDVDRPFQQQLEVGMDALRREGGSTQPGAPGPYNRDLAPGEAGRSVRDAAFDAARTRAEEVNRLYADLRARVPRDMPVTIPNTLEAINELRGRSMGRSRLPAVQASRAGLDDLMANAEQIRTFEDMDGLVKVIQDQVDDINTPMSRRDEAGNLLTALREDILKYYDDIGEAIPGAGGQAGRAKAAARADFDLADFSTRNLLKDPLKAGNIPSALRNMNVDQVRAIKAQIGATGYGPHSSTRAGQDAWNNVVAQVLDNIKAAAQNTERTTRDAYQLSGAKLASALRAYDDGVLEEVVGPQLHQGLMQLADISRGLTRGERMFSSTSRSNLGNNSLLQMASGIMHSPGRVTAEIVGHILSGKAAGFMLGNRTGQRYLLGETALQRPQTLLEILGRIGGQGGTQEGTRQMGWRQR